MLRLLQGFGQRNAAACGFGEIAGAQAVGGEGLRMEPGLGGAPLQDQIDGLRRQDARFEIAPWSMPPNTTRSLILARSSQSFKTSTGRPDEQHESVAVGLRRLCAAEPYCRIDRHGNLSPPGALGSAGTGSSSTSCSTRRAEISLRRRRCRRRR